MNQRICRDQATGNEWNKEHQGALRELRGRELERVGGGILPAIGFAGAVIGHVKFLGVTGGTITMAKGVAAHLVTGFGLGAAAFALGPRGASGKAYSATVAPE